MPVKTLKPSADSGTGIQVTDHTIQATVATANDVTGVLVDESGVYLRGNMSLMCMPENIRIGGLWTFGTGWQLMFPSTMAFPNPALYLSPPVKGIADMAVAVGWMMSMLG